VSKDTKYLCSECNPKKERMKLKEKTLKTFLESNNFVFDYNIACKCIDKYYFPDFKIDCNKFYIIIECDEYAHQSYIYDAERQREINIINGLSKPCIFLRYNPDKKGIKIKTKQEILKSYINYYMNSNVIQSEVSYLFY
jgi:very-short-patch-repair endonuclease